jgi:hypothetical protein
MEEGMNKTQLARKERLIPNGVPKYVRIYDNGGTDVEGGSIDRYTVVFTGKYRGNGWFQHIGMSGAPYHPQGFCCHGEDETQIDAPQGWAPAIGRKCYLGKRIHFSELNEDCKKVVISDYSDIWQLGEIV